MSRELPREVSLFLSSCFLGIELMAVYDIFRILRKCFRHRLWLIGMEDFLYWIISAFMTFSLLYKQNDGALRWYAVAGVFLGMVLLYHFIDRIFAKLLKIYRKCHRIRYNSSGRREKTRKNKRYKDER